MWFTKWQCPSIYQWDAPLEWYTVFLHQVPPGVVGENDKYITFMHSHNHHTQSLTHLHNHSHTQLITHSHIHPLTHSHIHSLTHTHVADIFLWPLSLVALACRFLVIRYFFSSNDRVFGSLSKQCSNALLAIVNRDEEDDTKR